jgi:hypothetical protein
MQLQNILNKSITLILSFPTITESKRKSIKLTIDIHTSPFFSIFGCQISEINFYNRVKYIISKTHRLLNLTIFGGLIGYSLGKSNLALKNPPNHR